MAAYGDRLIRLSDALAAMREVEEAEDVSKKGEVRR